MSMLTNREARIGLWSSTLIGMVLVGAGWPPNCLHPTIAAQTDQGSEQKLVEIDAMGQGDPVWIFNIAVGDQQIQPTVPFQAGGNWLKDMSVLLRNRTDKTIDYAEIGIRFPEAGDGRTASAIIYHTQLGQIPVVDRFTGHGQPIHGDPARKPLGFAPGDSLVVHFADYFDRIRAAVEQKMSFTEITRCVIHQGTVFFDDGTRWSGGFYGTPSPAR